VESVSDYSGYRDFDFEEKGHVGFLVGAHALQTIPLERVACIFLLCGIDDDAGKAGGR
jgi:hypothetical protein